MTPIADTAFGTAYCRALESDRPDALFMDPYARVLAGDRGAQVMHAMGDPSRMAWSVIVRTHIIDQWLLQTIQDGKVDTVLNLAAGLDTRPYRLPIPEPVQWIEVDLPAVLDYKRDRLGQIVSRCSVQSIAVDLSDRTARQSVFSNLSGRICVITEGLLLYLTTSQVQELATELHQTTNVHTWILDLVSPITLKLLQWQARSPDPASFPKFAPPDPDTLFAAVGWQIADTRSLWKTAHTLGRSVGIGNVIRHVPCFKDRVVLLKRSAHSH